MLHEAVTAVTAECAPNDDACASLTLHARPSLRLIIMLPSSHSHHHTPIITLPSSHFHHHAPIVTLPSSRMAGASDNSLAADDDYIARCLHPYGHGHNIRMGSWHARLAGLKSRAISFGQQHKRDAYRLVAFGPGDVTYRYMPAIPLPTVTCR